MDWKILVIVVAILLGFFVVQKCSDEEKPDYDRIQASKQAELKSASEQQKRAEERQIVSKAKETARKNRTKRLPSETVTLETEDFKAVLTNRGGALKSLTLKDNQYLEAPRNWTTGLREEDAETYVPVDLVTTNAVDSELQAPLRFEVYNSKELDGLLPDADYKLVEQTDKKVVFRLVQPGLPVSIVKKFEVDEKQAPFQLWLTVRVSNTSDHKVAFRSGITQQGYQHETEAEGGMFTKQPNLLQGICHYGEEVEALPWNDSDLDVPFSGIGKINFVGVETNYFLSAMTPADDTPASCYVANIIDNYRAVCAHCEKQPWGHVTAELRYAEVELRPGESKVFKVKNYLGPKRFRLLRSIGHGLEKSVDFGWFAPICQVLLAMLFAFQSFVNNWGLAIILLTVVVKVVLMPLTHRSFKSSERMKALKPEVDKINEKFKDNAQEKQQAVMALYKQHGVNPLGGCLPMLLQMPIWFALFRMLRASPELYRAPFFGWITDLSNPDPYFVTPIVMGAFMFIQQKMTPMATDSSQAKMMLYFMPIMFTAMMLFLPSGLTLYILVNTVLSIAHQVVIHRSSQKSKGAGNKGSVKKPG